ncbi:unnamed protein product [Tuber melanosporum]|uniref:(Perigord truffle) hypothetical protein n=1 Tax=Tuber melanosporum (strain Mel28) TaxID=656061 RepID=D5GGM2_TUBMM|nr:uncharacterized protein GSTUM_00007421001 [Tuber melanosporum]CAZ83644.1 unnamed protein product [Tuber melanosporum]
MSLSLGLFSRRKNSEDKASKAALCSSHVSTFASSPPSNITTSSTHDGYQPLPLPPHSAPPTHSRKPKLLTKAHPIRVPGHAADSGGIAFAPHLTRARTTNFNSLTPTPQQQQRRYHQKQSSISGLIRSNSDASGSRRVRSLDQRAPQLGSRVEGFVNIDSSNFPHPPSPDLPQCIPLPDSPAAFQNRCGSGSRPSSSTPRLPLAATRVDCRSHSNHGFYNPISEYPISPPLSPESPLRARAGRFNENIHKSEEELVMEIARLKEVITTRDHVIARYAANLNPGEINDVSSGTKGSEGQYANQILSHRIHDLEMANLEKNDEIARAAREMNSLREAHALEVQMLRNAAKRLEAPDGVGLEDLEDLDRYRRREFKLMDVVNGKEKELELLRSNANTLKDQVSVLEKSAAERDRELESARRQIQVMNEDRILIGGKPALVAISEMGLADIGRRLMDEIKRRERAERKLAESAMKSRSDHDAVLLGDRKREETRTNAWREMEHKLTQEELKSHETRRKAKENIDYVLAEEEKRRAELGRQFNERLETLRQEKEVFEGRITNMEVELEQAKQSVTTQREGNESLVQMITKINTRLGEEKKRNKQLEAKIDQITEDALNNVSGSKRACQDLKNVVEDRDTRIAYLESEVTVLKREKSALEEAWHLVESELERHSATLAKRDERIKDLETENVNILDRLEECQHDLEEARKNSPDRPVLGDSDSVTKRELDNLQQDLELYKQDVKAYRHDVKKRDAQIRGLNRTVADLESLLDRKPPPLSPFPPPPPAVSTPTSRPSTPTTANLLEEIATLKDKLRIYDQEYRGTYEDRESLRKKHATVTAQQNMIITDLDSTILRLRKEKESTEKAMKRMQANFLQLSQAATVGTLAVIKKYQEVPLPPLPAGSPSAPGSPIVPSSPVRRGSRRKDKRRSASTGSPVIGSMSGGEEKEKEKEQERRDRALSVVNEPDGALGEEEVIEW